MLSPAAFSDLLRDLAQLERPTRGVTPHYGQFIVDTFVRHSGARGGALYVALADDGYQLAAKKAEAQLPPSIPKHVESGADAALLRAESLAPFLSDEGCVVVPFSMARGVDGFLALGRNPEAPADDKLLRAASQYAGAILERRRMETEVREGEFQLKYRLWELESLYDIGLSIASTLNLDDLADEILVRTISLLNARSAALFLKSGTRFSMHRAFGEVRAEFFDEEIDAAQMCELVDRGCTLKLDEKADCIFPGCESFVALPIRGNREVIGILAAADREQRDGGVGAFEENDVRLLSQFANQAAIALENARLHREALQKQAMERELELAATIQKDILPRALPQVVGLEIATIARPAKQLGGDYYTFFERDGQLAFCVADVSGKSVPAAILVSALHAALQLLLDHTRDLGEIATDLNRHIHHWSAENKFVTMVLGTVDIRSNTLRYVNAGHNPAFLIADGEAKSLHSHGLPIGLMSGSRYATQTIDFAPGSLLAVYSDGISEAENAADEEFSEERLQKMLVEHAGESCDAIAARISSAVEDFVGDLPQKDDQTLVLLRAQ